METYLLLLGECLFSVAISCIALRVLSSPLLRVLSRICPDADSAAFWVAYTHIMLVVGPLLLVIVANFLTRTCDTESSLRFTAIAMLAGLLIGMRTLGKRLGAFVRFPGEDLAPAYPVTPTEFSSHAERSAK